RENVTETELALIGRLRLQRRRFFDLDIQHFESPPKRFITLLRKSIDLNRLRCQEFGSADFDRVPQNRPCWSLPSHTTARLRNIASLPPALHPGNCFAPLASFLRWISRADINNSKNRSSRIETSRVRLEVLLQELDSY
ncbi:MAG: hypothetical protein IIZ76_02235, partial [Clostridia bacterium]|nr:hypothetical protein [Clostridia bacterium]